MEVAVKTTTFVSTVVSGSFQSAAGGKQKIWHFYNTTYKTFSIHMFDANYWLQTVKWAKQTMVNLKFYFCTYISAMYSTQLMTVYPKLGPNHYAL